MANLTLEEIGQLAGVSRSTVSRVINNHKSVRPEVRRRVIQVIRETGYRPHAAARSLAAQKTRVLGLVIPRSVQSFFSDPYFPLLIQGISSACNRHRYTLSLFMFSSEEEEEKLYPRVVGRGALDGVILSSSVADDPLLPRLQASNMPFVLVGRPLREGPLHFVDVDNVGGAYTAVSHLAAQGRQRIATITGPLNTAVGRDRRQGYLDALQGLGLPSEEALVVEGDFTETGGYEALKRILGHQPDALFAASDRMALGAMRALQDQGVAVPEEVAVVGFDDLEMGAISQPPLTSVRQPIRRTGALAVETLLNMLENEWTDLQQTILPTSLVVRASCGSAS